MKSLSEKRLIVQCTINDKEANFLLDTGASVGLINKRVKKRYSLSVGRRFPQPIIGAGGEIDAYYCNTFVQFSGKTITQFLIADIDDVVDSIKETTGIEIVGLIGLEQMKVVGIKIDANSNEIFLED